MLLEKRIKENKNYIKKRRVLNYIALVKFLSMTLIIRWHIYQRKHPRIDFGARMCELLFVSSGFLIGYNYYERAMPATYHTSCKYTYKHLRSFYPLHIINSIYCIYIYKRHFSLTDYEIFIFNFLLLKVWSIYSSFAMGFNGIAWFISALLFCYFLSPFLLEGNKNIKNSLIIFSFVSFIRVGQEEICN